MRKKILIVFMMFISSILISTVTNVQSQETSVILDNNFTGIWQGKNPTPEFSSTSLVNCETLVDCPQKNIHCDHNEQYLVQTCDTCARCVKASRIITLKLCLSEGRILGTVHQGGIINKGTIISQTVFSPSDVVLNIQDEKGKSSTLTLKLLESGKKLHGTFSYGIGFNARKLKASGCG